MRVAPSIRDAHGTAILDAAAALFRARGVEGVSVAEISRAAGLTHGAFYGHFASKEALAAAACSHTLRASASAWRRRADRARAAGRDGLDGLIERYLTPDHRDTPAHGCALAALGGELARGAAGTRAALSAGVEGLLAVLADEIAVVRPDLSAVETQFRALGVLATLSGGLTLARAITDPDRSAAALAATAAAARAAVSA